MLDALPCECFKISVFNRSYHGKMFLFRLLQKAFHAKTMRSYAMRSGIGLFDRFNQVFVSRSFEQFSMKYRITLKDCFQGLFSQWPYYALPAHFEAHPTKGNLRAAYQPRGRLMQNTADDVKCLDLLA